MQTPPSQAHHYPVLSLMMYTCKSKLKLKLTTATRGSRHRRHSPTTYGSYPVLCLMMLFLLTVPDDVFTHNKKRKKSKQTKPD